MALAAVKWVISNRTIWKHLFPNQTGALYCVYNIIHIYTFTLHILCICIHYI
uniref:Uncharacterized protein n=1 Tax=Neovison vison TaxID=452646 RepID=A0A8C7AS82_NEOVI